MRVRSRQGTRGVGILWFIVGLAFVLSDNPVGWFFFMLGLAFLAKTTDLGEALASDNPMMAEWLLARFTALMVLIMLLLLVLKYL